MRVANGGAAHRLGELSELDPYTLEPGVILAERFCVVGPVLHSERGWRVAVTDLAREFGASPHHRVEVHHLSMSHADRARLERAIRADSVVQPAVFMVVESLDGVDLVTEERKPFAAETPDAGARTELVLALTELLALLHKNRVTGVRFSANQLGSHDRSWQLTSFAHLVRDEGEAKDVRALEQLIRELLGAQADPLLTPAPESADELSCRVRAFYAHRPLVASDVLPSEAPFVGRESDLEALQANYRNAVVARPSLTVLEGERGVGKSRLVEEFEGWARTQTEALVVRGEFVESPNRHETGMGEALRELGEILRRLDPMRTAELAKRLSSAVPEPGVLVKQVPALDDLIDAEEPPSFQLEDEFIRFTETISAFLLHVGTGQRPLVIVLENGEHADACTLGVLRHLAAASPGSHLQVVMTMRGSMPDELREAGAEARPIGPLDVPTIGDLVTASLPGTVEDLDRIARELHRSAEGLPLAAWAALQLWVRDGALRRDAGGAWRRDPTKQPEFGVEVLLRHRLERLDDTARDVAVLLASREGVVDLGWLAEVEETSTDEARHRLDALREAGIVSRAQTGYRFWHDEVRRVVVELASSEQIQAAHRKVAKWLRKLPRASVAQLAFHEELAGLAHDGMATQHVRAARELLDVYESRAAKWHLECALAWELPADERIVAMEAAGDASLLSGDAERAAEWYVKAVQDAADDVAAVVLAGRAVRALYARAAGDAGIRVGTAALERVGSPLPRSTPAKVIAFLWAFLMKGRPVRRLSPELRSALCRLYTEVSACMLVRDPMNVGVATLHSYRLSHGLRTGSASLAVTFYAALRAMLGHRKAANRLLEQSEALALEASDDWALATVHHIRGQTVQLPIGAYSEGQASLARAVECFRRTGDVSVAAASLFFRAVYGYERESAEQVLAWLVETDSMAVRHGNELVRLDTAALRLFIEARLGRREVVLEAERIEAGIDRGNVVTHDVLIASTYVAAALLEAGAVQAAKTRILTAATMVPSLPGMLDVAMDFYVVLVQVLLAQTQLESGDWKLVRAALKKLGRAGKYSPRLYANYLLGAAKLARRTGQVERAKSLLETLLTSEHASDLRYVIADGHSELFRVLGASEVLAAAEHARQAASIKANLGYRRKLPEALTEPAGELPPAKNVERSETAVAPEIQTDHLLSAFAEVEASVLGLLNDVPLRLKIEDGVYVRCSTSELQSIAVNLLLSARDAVPGIVDAQIGLRAEEVNQSRASGLAGATAGSFAVLQVRVRARGGPETSSFGGLIGCRLAINKVGGFLVVEPLHGVGVSLSAYLPGGGERPADADVGPSRTAVVIHPDAMTRKTIIAALSRMGFECQDAFAMEGELPAGAMVFADGAALRSLELEGGVKVVELVGRGKDGHTAFEKLSVPFAVGELEDLVG